MKATTECWKAISELNGYLKAVKNDLSSGFLKLLHICEARQAMEIEGNNLSFIRIFESYASENNLNESIAKQIFELASIPGNLKQVNVNALNLSFSSMQRSRKGIIQQAQNTKEINTYLNEPPRTDALLYLGLMHGFLAVQRNELKNQVFYANTLVNHWMKENDLLEIPILPMALFLKDNLREADALLKEAFETGAMQNWILFFLGLLQAASQSRLRQLQNMIQLKQSNSGIISKYTSYNLPETELPELLFESPFIKARDIIERVGCHRQTAYAYLSHLEQAGILIEKKSGREKLYFHKRLFDALIAG